MVDRTPPPPLGPPQFLLNFLNINYLRHRICLLLLKELPSHPLNSDYGKFLVYSASIRTGRTGLHVLQSQLGKQTGRR